MTPSTDANDPHGASDGSPRPGRSGGSRWPLWLAALALGGVFAGGLVWSTVREQGVRCEICITFGGRTACRSATGADRNRAVYGARQAACAVLSGGVTQGMQCDRTPPDSLTCTP